MPKNVEAKVEARKAKKEKKIRAEEPKTFPEAAKDLASLQHLLGLHREIGEEDVNRNASNTPVLVCMDCEAFEFAPKKITEVGVAILDPLDLHNLPPGSNSVEDWAAKIKAAHYRPVEYSKLRNRRWVKGCEESFNFGETTWVHLKDFPSILQRIFAAPTQLERAARFNEDVKGDDRMVIFIAHGADNEYEYFNQLGFNLAGTPNLLRILDTQKLVGRSRKQPTGLHRLLVSLEIAPYNLHNGGNDAVYTMHALLAMALKDYKELGSISRGIDIVGKLGTEERRDGKAPHVWAGTAVAPEELLVT